MLACVDVYYREARAVAACVWGRNWTDAEPAGETTMALSPTEAYLPGQFYRRELPCILAVLGSVAEAFDTVVIDGYVWLDGQMRPGLGAHLFQALGAKVPVVGVAKSPFHGATIGREVFRGASRRPLIVTAVGMELSLAADLVKGMHGPFRIPTFLRRVDMLSRKAL
jgi:deoxyribonuclease V